MSPPSAEPDLLDSPQAGGTAIRGTAIRAAGFGVITLLSVATAPILTRYLGTVDFGRYSVVVALIALVTTITEAGLSSLGVRELAVRSRDAGARLMRDLLGVRIALTFVGVAGALAFAQLAGYGSTLVAGTALAGVGALVFALQAVLQMPLLASLRLGWVTASDVSRQLVFLATVIVLVVLDAGLLALLSVPILAGVVGAAVAAVAARGDAPMRPSLDGRAWLQIVRQTLPIAAASAIYGVYFRLVILMMSLLATDVETGVFAISFRVIEVLVMLPFLLVGSLLPLFSRAARDDQARLRFAFGRTLDATIFAGAGLSVVTFAGAPLAVAILTGGGGATVEVLQIQALTLFAVFVDVAYGSLMIAMRWHRELIVLNLITLAITVAAVFALVPDHGAHGGAIAATAGEYALLVGYVVCVRLRRRDLHPAFATLPRAALAAALAIAAAELVELPLPHDAGQPAVAAVVYLVAMWALRAIPVELTDALRPAVSRRS